ncbi:phospholipase D-like domain-containing protein [Altererythrobacter sp. Root672]|uniref:phospholipase D-like domain-containing protein n=1 Tax=Altererythrobacter sp. Root672 TaxID=1736584 RepID=UPI0006F7C4BA|nr:phospholipase D-like domain-containing protein [Altererythrobacter sp. Root672]KRA83552.1 phospholipase [Altererythrobacter sp. Root672]
MNASGGALGVGKNDPAFDDRSIEPGVWRYAMASRARLIVDAEAYFDLMQQAMLKARQRILLIGWDVDTRVHLTHGRRWWQRGWNRNFPARLGGFIPWLTRNRQGLEVRILKWGVGALKFAFRGSMMLDLIRWFPNRRIDFKFDSIHPLGCSHHQKIVVIDKALAVCGGIDMTVGRWDTPKHLEQDARRKTPNGAPYFPWHDMTMMMEGPVAAELEALALNRWVRAGGKPLTPSTPSDDSAWPDGLDPHFENVEVGIARTRPEYDEDPGVREIEALFRQHIARAKRFIYAESQYFASRVIAEAITARMAEADPPEVVIVQPISANGWIEATAMDPARAQLVAAIREIDEHARFHIYTPYSGETPIYVHAKVMIVDDQILRVGSANFNNRSMGLDTECDVFIDCERPANGHCGAMIRDLRHSLLAEHCGISAEEVAELIERTGSMAGMIALIGKDSGRHLMPFHPEVPAELPLKLAANEVLDPEEPAEMFQIRGPRRGLLRNGGLLARAMTRVKRKYRPQ